MHKAVLAAIKVVFTFLVGASLWLWFELDRRGARGLALWLPPPRSRHQHEYQDRSNR